MKKRRTDLIKTRKEGEKEKMKDEENQRRIAAEKSFKAKTRDSI